MKRPRYWLGRVEERLMELERAKVMPWPVKSLYSGMMEKMKEVEKERGRPEEEFLKGRGVGKKTWLLFCFEVSVSLKRPLEVMLEMPSR